MKTTREPEPRYVELQIQFKDNRCLVFNELSNPTLLETLSRQNFCQQQTMQVSPIQKIDFPLNYRTLTQIIIVKFPNTRQQWNALSKNITVPQNDRCKKAGPLLGGVINLALLNSRERSTCLLYLP